MKRLFITGLLAVLTFSIFAQSTTTSNESVKLKIRKKTKQDFKSGKICDEVNHLF